ncbi:MAG: DUF2188 domain-containing protein [Chloroflexi bacterium]|nr:DUF2188 domain-containing protein [Chloroflexota bacterium]
MTYDIEDELNVKQVLVSHAGASETDSDPEFILGNYSVIVRDDSGFAVGLDTHLTPELVDEGVKRELVRRLQNLRKAAGLEVSDRIVAYYSGSDRVAAVLATHGDYVRAETLADELVAGDPPYGATAEQVKIEGVQVTLAVRPKRITYDVTPYRDKWRVTKRGASRASGTFERKQDAVSRARHLAKSQTLGQLVIRRQDGVIQTEHKYGRTTGEVEAVRKA